MPLIETICSNPDCRESRRATEHFLWHAEDPNPPCDQCGSETKRLISRFSAPWTGTLSRFFDPKKSRHNCTDDGHIAYRVRSSRLANGAPEPVHIRTRQDQIEFCKAEGLLDPLEVNSNLHATADGMTGSTQGLPGSWT